MAKRRASLPPDGTEFTIGIVSLRDLARQKGWQFEEDEKEQRVKRADGVIAIRAPKRRRR